MPDFDADKPTWNFAQLLVWVVARDETLVAKFSDGSVDFGRRIASLLYVLTRSNIAPDIVRANRFILHALCTGRLPAYGEAPGKRTQKKVPSRQWAWLEITPSKGGLYARPRDGAIGQATTWRQLRVSAERAVAIWPPSPRKRQNRGGHDALMVLVERESASSRSEFYLTEKQLAARDLRWQREMGRIEPLALSGLLNDGLSDDPDSTATEVLSWMALGMAIPPSTWKLFTAVGDRLSDFRIARYRLSLARRHYREARRPYLLELLEPHRLSNDPFSISDAEIRSQVTETNVLEAKQRLEKAHSRYLEAASVELLVFRNIASVSGLGDQKSGWEWFVNRIQDLERLLFKAIRENALVLRGRRSTASVEWETIPTDHIRLPVQLNMQRNSLEPSGEGSMEDYKAVREGMPEWIDLLFRTSEVRANADRLGHRRETGASGAGSSMQTGTAGGETLCRKWLTELMKKEDRPARSKEAVRDECLAKFSISKRAFDRAWARAVADSGNRNWSQSGPRSSKR